jgi:hypothetical protein
MCAVYFPCPFGQTAPVDPPQEMAAQANDALMSLTAAIDAALRPAGVLHDLSRIIAQFARPIRWAADERFTIADSASGACTAALKPAASKEWIWLSSDAVIGQFPSPSKSSDAKVVSSALRVWTVRIDAADSTIFLGICKPSRAPGSNPFTDSHTVHVCTGSSFASVGCDAKDVDIPHSVAGAAGGSLYHFTADLSAGTLRVRPFIERIHPDYQLPDCPQTEWTLVHGLSDLGECRAGVCLPADAAVTFSLVFE